MTKSPDISTTSASILTFFFSPSQLYEYATLNHQSTPLIREIIITTLPGSLVHPGGKENISDAQNVKYLFLLCFYCETVDSLTSSSVLQHIHRQERLRTYILPTYLKIKRMNGKSNIHHTGALPYMNMKCAREL